MKKTKATTQSQPRGVSAPILSYPIAPSEKAADRSPASGTVEDLHTVTKAALGRIPKAKRAKDASAAKVCPECSHVFKGSGWDGIDAHWKAKHSRIMPYDEAWPLLQAGTYETRKAGL